MNPSEKKTSRFNLFMSPAELEAIEEWAWANRIRSLSEAMRQLMQLGLHASSQGHTLPDSDGDA